MFVSKHGNFRFNYSRFYLPYEKGAVVAVFFISWAPFHVQRLAYHYHHFFNLPWYTIQTFLTNKILTLTSRNSSH